MKNIILFLLILIPFLSYSQTGILEEGGYKIKGTTTGHVLTWNGTNWAGQAAIGLGTGTQNYFPKWGTGGISLTGISLLFDNGTNVGVGTTSPQQKLDVNGTVNSNEFRLQNASFTRVASSDGGGGFISGYNSVNSGGSAAHDSNGTLNAIQYTAGGIRFYSNVSNTAGTIASSRMTLTPTGLGIGSNASEAIDIIGNVKFSGALMPNNLPGTAGQFLTSAGTGVAPTWTSFTGVTGTGSNTYIPIWTGASTQNYSNNLFFTSDKLLQVGDFTTGGGINVRGLINVDPGGVTLASGQTKLITSLFNSSNTGVNNVEVFGNYSNLTISNDGTPTGGGLNAYRAEVNTSGVTAIGNTSAVTATVTNSSPNVGQMYGVYGRIDENSTSGSLSFRQGLRFDVNKNSDGFTSHSGTGINVAVKDVSSTGRWAAGTGIEASVSQSQDALGVNLSVISNRGTGNTNKGLFVNNTISGSGVTAGNAIGIDLFSATSGGATLTNYYGIFQSAIPTVSGNLYTYYNDKISKFYQQGEAGIGGTPSTAQRLYVNQGGVGVRTAITVENNDAADGNSVAIDFKNNNVVTGRVISSNPNPGVGGMSFQPRDASSASPQNYFELTDEDQIKLNKAMVIGSESLSSGAVQITGDFSISNLESGATSATLPEIVGAPVSANQVEIGTLLTVPNNTTVDIIVTRGGAADLLTSSGTGVSSLLLKAGQTLFLTAVSLNKWSYSITGNDVSEKFTLINLAGVSTGSLTLTNANTDNLIYNGAATVTTLTVTLPNSPINGQVCKISTGSGMSVTSLTMVGATPSIHPTTWPAGSSVEYKYYSTLSAWVIKSRN